MIKLLIAALLLSVTTAFAKGSSNPGSAGTQTSIIRLDQYPRVLQFSSDRNWSTEDGQILVCPYSSKADWRDNTCLNANGMNSWKLMTELVLPGVVLAGYQFIYIGSGGLRTLLVFFEKADVK